MKILKRLLGLLYMSPAIVLIYYILKLYPDLQKGVIWTVFFLVVVLILVAIGILFFKGMDKLIGR